MERLHKVMAHAGVASRRAAERMIREGLVRVNGEVVTSMGRLVDPTRDSILVDGRKLPAAPARHTYLLLNKPRGCVTTLRDPEGRRTVLDLLRGVAARVYPVGRLDFDSEGLLLLTDDGDLARDLMHPRSGVEKTYLAKVRGSPGPEALARLERGVVVGGRPTLPAKARILKRGDNAWVEVRIVEGRNRQVRRMLESVGHPVARLRRVAYAGLTLGALPPGAFRELRPAEVALLRRAAPGALGGPGGERRPDRA